MIIVYFPSSCRQVQGPLRNVLAASRLAKAAPWLLRESWRCYSCWGMGRKLRADSFSERQARRVGPSATAEYLLMLPTSSGRDPSVCPSFGSVGRRPVSSSGMQLVSRSSGARSRYRSIAACAAYWLSIYMCRRRLSAQRAASVVWSEEDRLDRHRTCW